ncbi:adenylate/guanylate cyclase domain-containing protein [Streptosporangium carneum]|uniref:Guanylate cyclase n=1 Tax=Streptosporangium carneum TaxID=47481 RepID=A0A9W6I5P1_9ACTN|nr:adenylate/guanylate cyclase domain-containing protein [Streptosporangium carneum]GLK12172.1 guanylate cyclase [Streptosporangium carneum]
MRCPSCLAVSPGRPRFCPSCGTRLAAATPPEARKIVTVVFCDLAESTALSERLDPESLRAVLIRYFALMRDQLAWHGGTVEKFIGDAVMAVFGVPELHEDDALRAARAAVDMREALDGLNDDLERALGIRLKVRIGVNTGEVVASGHAYGEQALVAGEVVNTAARLQQFAGPGEILLGQETWRLVGPSAVGTQVGQLELRGKRRTTTAWRLVSMRSDDPAVARRFDVPFVDRREPLRELDLALEEVIRRRECRIVTLHGEAGIGKTRLARLWLARAGERGVLVGSGRCRPYGAGGTLLGVADAVRELVTVGAPDPEALAVLRAGLLRDGTPNPSHQETSRALRGLLQDLGRSAGVLIVLDDVHWAARSVFDLLGDLAEELRDAAVMVLCVTRPDLFERLPDWQPGSRLALPRLGPEDSRLLVSELVEVMPHDSALVDRIADRAEGNPLYLEQLVAMLRDGGEPHSLPPTVHSLIAARVDGLGQAARSVLECAAVIGREFTVEQLRSICEPDDLGALLELLERKCFVEHRTEVTFRFSGALIQEVVYGGMAKRRRAELHERFAGWLAVASGGDEAVGTHLEQAYRHRADLGPPDEHTLRLRGGAAARIVGAGTVALRRSDLSRAENLLSRGADLLGPDDPGWLGVSGRVAEAQITLGEIERGRRLLSEVLEQAGGGADPLVAAHASLYLAHFDPSRAFEVARRAVPVFEEAGDDLGLARAWTMVAQEAQGRGRFADTGTMLRRALGYALRSDAELERATILGNLAVSLWLGPEPAPLAISECRALMAAHGRDRGTVRAVVGCPLAVLLATRGKFDEARATLEAAEHVFADLRHAYAGAFTPIFSASVESLAGRWDLAEELLHRARARAEELGDGQLVATASRDLAWALLHRRDVAGAERLARTALEGSEEVAPVNTAELRAVQARVLALRGADEDVCEELMERALREAGETDSPVCRATVLLSNARGLLSLGARDRGRSAARAAAAEFAAKGHLVGRALALAAAGRR